MDAEPGKVWPSPGDSGTVEGDLWAGNELHKHLMRALKPTGHRKPVWDEQVDIQPFVGLDLVVPSAGTVGGQMGTLAEATPFNWSPRGVRGWTYAFLTLSFCFDQNAGIRKDSSLSLSLVPPLTLGAGTLPLPTKPHIPIGKAGLPKWCRS